MGSKSYRAGDTATVTFVRNGQVMTTELTFGSTTEMPKEETSPADSGNTPGGYGSSYGDTYGDSYGTMDDFFNEFFGGRAG